ncbi:MAG TPA: hypothetical protein VMF50_05795 [Candidatus Binataceae bacterium]|nr:hypothetical protein [Candidatus Binataceae bacterium]
MIATSGSCVTALVLLLESGLVEDCDCGLEGDAERVGTAPGEACEAGMAAEAGGKDWAPAEVSLASSNSATVALIPKPNDDIDNTPPA